MTQTEKPSAVLMRLVRGYQISQAIHVAAVLGVADLMGQGARGTDDLAEACNAHPDTMYRLLRALAAIGVFEEGPDRAFSLTSVGECLRSDSDEPARDWAIFIGQEYYWNAWRNLLKGVVSGQNVFPQLHGVDVWQYRAANPETSATFDRAMASMSRMVSRALLSAYDFSGLGLIIDVGGGNGALLADILAAHPAARGVLFDRPHVVSAEHLKAVGASDRCEVVGGNFFKSVPEGGDAYILKFIIHDWADEDAVAILKTCRRAIAPSGKLLLLEQVVGPPNTGPGPKFSDLNMLVMPGGQERSREELAGLLEAAHFRLSQVVPLGPDMVCVIESLPV